LRKQEKLHKLLKKISRTCTEKLAALSFETLDPKIIWFRTIELNHFLEPVEGDVL
jgi:hypothetical protein